MTLQELVAVLTPYALAYRVDLDEPTYLAYYQVLGEGQAAQLQAALKAHSAAGSRFFPTAPELLAEVERRQPRVVGMDLGNRRALPAPVEIPTPGKTLHITHEHAYECTRCSDTGWRSWVCGVTVGYKYPWLPTEPCQRIEPHPDHEWSDWCPCRPTNRTYQRKRQRECQQAASRTAGKMRGGGES